MKVEEYVELRKEELDKFVKWWDAMREEDPGCFPEKLDEGDWNMQEEAYYECVLGKESGGG